MSAVETKIQPGTLAHAVPGGGAFSVQLLSKQLNVSVRTTHRLISSGGLRAHRIGRQWRVFERDLRDYLARRASGGGESEGKAA